MLTITLIVAIIICLLAMHQMKVNSESSTAALKQQVESIQHNNSIEQNKLYDEIHHLQAQVEQEKKKNEVVVSQRKSSECRTGLILETMAPILKLFENHNLKEIRWLGSPLDYIAFDFSEEDPKITFLEIKTGSSIENKRQKLIKNMIKTGRVYYEQIRINDKGITSKIEENVE